MYKLQVIESPAVVKSTWMKQRMNFRFHNLCGISYAIFLYPDRKASISIRVTTVCGPVLAKYGVQPFQRAVIPSFLLVFIRTSNIPLYSGFPSIIWKYELIMWHVCHISWLTFIFCVLVLAISTGSEAQVVMKPATIEPRNDKKYPSFT